MPRKRLCGPTWKRAGFLSGADTKTDKRNGSKWHHSRGDKHVRSDSADGGHPAATAEYRRRPAPQPGHDARGSACANSPSLDGYWNAEPPWIARIDEHVAEG